MTRRPGQWKVRGTYTYTPTGISSRPFASGSARRFAELCHRRSFRPARALFRDPLAFHVHRAPAVAFIVNLN